MQQTKQQQMDKLAEAVHCMKEALIWLIHDIGKTPHTSNIKYFLDEAEKELEGMI